MKNSFLLIIIIGILSSMTVPMSAQFDKLKKSVDKSISGISKTVKSASDTNTTSTQPTSSSRSESKSMPSATGSGTDYYIRPDGRGKDEPKNHLPKILLP